MEDKLGFNSLIGNEKVKEVLESIVKNRNILHSYMFIGQEGIGKMIFAKEFANMIFESVDEENNQDLSIIEPEDGKSIKIEQIRNLQQRIIEKPVKHEKKIYIINDSDLMTKEAQNCLLKTLEEPPEYIVLILITSSEDKILTTIKSRCVKINFEKINDEDIKKYINDNYEKNDLNDNMLKLCNGSIGKAISILNQQELYEQLDNIMRNIDNKDIIDLWNESEILYKSKDDIINLLDYINIIIYNKIHKEQKIEYLNCINIVEEAKSSLNSNANYDMTIDVLLLKIWEEINEKHRRSKI